MRVLLAVIGIGAVALASVALTVRFGIVHRRDQVGIVDLQAALDAAAPGDTISLTPGVVYTGPFHLPKKAGAEWIVVQSTSSGRTALEGSGRVQPTADAARMAKLVSSSGPVITADAGAHHYRFVNVEISPTPGVYLTNLVDLGSSATVPEDTPHDLAFDRCYVHGDAAKGSRRGIALNSASTSITNSYFSDFKEVGADSQAIAGWNGPGPFTITNNYLEGAGENVMFGGADPLIPNLVPGDIVVKRNLFSKPLTWQLGNREYAGTPWTVKNLFELKNAERVQVDGNIFEYNWVQAQNGFAILFTVRNQDGSAPWSTVADVSFTNNVVRHVAAAVNILGHDDINVSQPAHRIQIRNNLFLDVGGSWSFGRLFQLLNGADEVSITHNTAMQTETMLFGGDTLPHAGFVFTDNLAPHNQYGVIGSGTGVGLPTLEHFFPGAVFAGNVVVGGDATLYPQGNFFPPSMTAAGLTVSGLDAALQAGSPFKSRATDGGDPGIDARALLAALGADAVPRGAGTPGGRLWEVVFWISGGLLVYVYLGYGILIAVEANTRRRGRPPAATACPTVTVIVVAHNEQRWMHRRLRNLLALDYPRERLEVLMGSDGSTDRTVEIGRTFEPAVRVVAYDGRRGKAAVLNDLVPLAHGDILVFSDARQVFERGALRALVQPFSDSTVGAVSGELVLQRGAADDAATAAGVYWTYEKWIRRWESRVDSTMGVTGAIYAIQRWLFEPIPPDTILDDVLIPSRAIRRGYRVLFEPGAVAYDYVAASPHEEFVRKVRTIAGTFQFFVREPWTLNPIRNRVWLQTVSHKLLRLGLPVDYLALLISNIALARASSVFVWALGLQVLFYGAAILATNPKVRSHLRAVAVPHMLLLLSWATVVAFVKFATGRQAVTWQRSSSPSS